MPKIKVRFLFQLKQEIGSWNETLIIRQDVNLINIKAGKMSHIV